MNILIRADSSSTIGTGHIMRDLVLAEQFEDAKITFATQDLAGQINHKIEEKKYTIKILNSNESDELISLIKSDAIDMIVIDHYGINDQFEKELKEQTGVKIFVLDDTYERHHCDILLNHNVYADPVRYKDLVPRNSELRCGSKFTLLRDEFQIQKLKDKKKNQAKKNVLIAMGGADHSNLNPEIIKALQNFPNLHANIVTTTSNQYLDELKACTLGNKNITLHINTSQIASLMHEASFAIVTPSVTVNEIIYMDIPFIAIKTASNQDEMYQYLLKEKFVVLEKSNTRILENEIRLLLETLSIELINFIDLSLDEKRMVLTWRNNPNIRKWMFSQEIIEIKDHLAYVNSLNKREDRLYFLVKQEGQAIGVIDFTNIDYQKRSTEFGIYANPELKGVGQILMKAIIDYAFNSLKVKTLISAVIEENLPAIKLYKRYDFKEVEIKKVDNKNIIYMELKNENR
ncbi:UDP-2,4-diacetamido-2,4,6-trideoxy-beta-L-altropyranose hydrolase [Sulfurovum sp.]|uniref:UDP-2,4-diacetamido-2,4, 6-trideoxy-beta-L-altropyranose hydrolase n=1 Tax=Sulfurovum sp. TaxID=1969726 RepID=UPI0035675C55